MAHRTKLRLSKREGEKDLNPSFFLPRITSKDAVQLEDALSTVVLPAKVYKDKIEDEFYGEFSPKTHPQGGTSLSGSTMSSRVQAKSRKSSSQKSVGSEKSVPELGKINPQREEERFRSCPEEQREENKTPEELFQEHFTAEPVRDEILEEPISFQGAMNLPTVHPQEEWRDLEIVEEDLVSAASSAENKPSRRGSKRNE